MVKKKKKKTGYMIKDGILEKVPEKEVEEKTEAKASITIPSLESTSSGSPSVSVDLHLPVPKTLDLIQVITQEIFHKVVAPVCSVPGMNFNFLTAKFSDYDNAIPKYRKQILEKILEKYAVDRNILETLQDLPMSLTAMYIVDKMND